MQSDSMPVQTFAQELPNPMTAQIARRKVVPPCGNANMIRKPATMMTLRNRTQFLLPIFAVPHGMTVQPMSSVIVMVVNIGAIIIGLPTT